MINHIVQFENRNTIRYQVYYDSGRKVCYGENDNLPLTVLNFLLDDNVKIETEYHWTGKVTRYRK